MKDDIIRPQKEMTCCKCKKKFYSDLDERRVPYNRLCQKCNDNIRENGLYRGVYEAETAR